MSNQAVFDAAWLHIMKQGQASFSRGTCQYRHSDTIGCAFAPCIARYHKSMEGGNAEHLIREFPDRLHVWALDCDLELAYAVQLAHDRNSGYPTSLFLERFESAMREIAGNAGLTIPEKGAVT